MTIAQRIAREPALITSAVRAVLYCGVLFGLDLSVEQIAGVVLSLEAVLALVTRALSVPASEVVAQKTPGQVIPTAGPASDVANGADVHIVEILGKA